MLPTVSIQRKRSSSKLIIDFSTSPGTDKLIRSQKNKSLTGFNAYSPLPSKTFLKEFDINTTKQRESRKFLTTQVYEPLKTSTKAQDFEEILNDRLEKYNRGNSEYISEIDVIDSVFYDVLSHLKSYENIFRVLRQKLDVCIFDQAKEEYTNKIEKLKKDKDVLVMKINSLSDINSKLQEENRKLNENRENFTRLFIDDPDVLINYQNIVEQMLEQCNIIREQKKELKKLRKYQGMYKALVKEFDQKSFILEPHDITK